MNCTEARTAMDDRLDGLLNEAAGAELDEHLHGCAACRRVWTQLQAMSSGLAWLGEQSEPWSEGQYGSMAASSDAQRTANEAAASPKGAGRIYRLWRIGATAAAAALLLAAGVRLMLPSASPQGPSESPTRIAAQSPGTPVTAVEPTAFDFRLTAASQSDYIAVARPTRSSRVHVVLLYPVDRPRTGEPQSRT